MHLTPKVAVRYSLYLYDKAFNRLWDKAFNSLWDKAFNILRDLAVIQAHCLTVSSVYTCSKTKSFNDTRFHFLSRVTFVSNI